MYKKVLAQFNAIRDTSGSKAKAGLVALYMADAEFQSVLRLMLNPFMMFGVNKVQEHHTDHTELGSNEVSFADFQLIMLQLANRVITGQAAADALTCLTANGVPIELLTRIINKETGAGFGVATVNKISKDFIPTFPYMRCTRSSDVKKPLDYSKGRIIQVKEDGMFANCDHEEHGHVMMRTRQGTPIPMEFFPHLKTAVRELLAPGTQTHGELVVYKAGIAMERALGNGLINSVIGGTAQFAADEKVYFIVWDQIPLKAVKTKGKYLVPYKTRFAPLQALDDMGYVRCIEYTTAYSKEEQRAFFKKIVSLGGEGDVDKDPEMSWEDGTSRGQIKHKMEAQATLCIKGFREGRNKFASTFGSIIGETEDGLLEAAVSGISDKDRESIWKRREELIGTFMDVKFNVVTSPSQSNEKHSLFLPRFDKLRPDLTEADGLLGVKANYDLAVENA